ncbi:MAG: HlyD family efflux transporter periplasmic adaptor subunit [Planctomycetaceae bacterium]|nr:HlyD family efflux transporter periplasmic adaptor subunit [Planctomycetaceae bacterium]
MKLSLKNIIGGIVLVAVIAAVMTSLTPPPVDVETAAVAEGPLVLTVREDGKTRIREKYVVSSPVTGRLARIELQEGDDLEAESSLLAVILPSEPELLDARAQAEAEARVLAAEADVIRADVASEQARIQFELSEANFERNRTLREKNSVSQSDYDVAETAFRSAEQAVRAAAFDQQIAQFERDMAEAAARQFSGLSPGESAEPFEIHAPIGGKVLRVLQESSTVVTQGMPLLEIGDPRNLEVEIDVLSTDAVRIQPGAEVLIDHWGGGFPLHAQVRVIEPAAFTRVSSLGVEEQRVNVIADFTDSQGSYSSLGDGYRVEGQITIQRLDNVLQIPASALFRHQREWHVLKVVDSKAVLQPVDVGQQSDTAAEIRSGLSADEQVILYPSDRISNGTRVSVTGDADR